MLFAILHPFFFRTQLPILLQCRSSRRVFGYAVLVLLMVAGCSRAHGMQRLHLSVEPFAAQAQSAAAGAVPLSSSARDFSLSLAPIPENLQRGGNVTVLAIVAGLGSFSDPVTLAIDGSLPQWLTITFSPSIVTPVAPKPGWTATSGSRVYIDTSTVPNFYVNRRQPVQSRSIHAALASVPFMILLPLAFCRWGRRRMAPLLAMAALACLPLAGGCGAGRYPPQVAPGTYQINITGTAATGQQHTLPIVLRVVGG